MKTMEELLHITEDQLNDELFSKYQVRWIQVGFAETVIKLGNVILTEIAGSVEQIATMFYSPIPLTCVSQIYNDLHRKFCDLEALQTEIITISNNLNMTTYFFQGLINKVNEARFVLDRVVSLKEILTMLIEQFKDITKVGVNKEERDKNINDYFNIIKPHILKYQKKMNDLANLYLVYGEKLKRLNSQDEERQEIEKSFFLAH